MTLGNEATQNGAINTPSAPGVPVDAAGRRHGFDTLAIHAGQEPDPVTGAVAPAIHPSSTFKQDGVGGMRAGYDYSRAGNPTRTALQECLAALEGGTHGFAFSSGLAAADSLLRMVCRPGDHLLIPNDAYGGTYRLISQVFSAWGLEFSVADLTNPADVRANLRSNTRAIWCETPSNPLLAITDIGQLSALARERGAMTIVDNTFASPYLQQPLDAGADVVVHSTTKYIGGHSDVVGGAVVTRDAALGERLEFAQKSVGSVPSPFDAWITLRGIKTLAVRMDRHSDNAERIADWLSRHPKVSRVHYPGLSSHPGHETAAKQMRRFGGMISFQVHGGEETAIGVCDRAELFTLAESLGGVESLIEHPGRMTHASVAGSTLQVPDDLVRLSVGIENADDLIADLAHALG